MALTSLDLGDIFLTVISTQSFETSLRSITFREFWEVLIRCALVAFRKTKVFSFPPAPLCSLGSYLHCQQAEGNVSLSLETYATLYSRKSKR